MDFGNCFRWIFLPAVLCLILPLSSCLPDGETLSYSFVHISDTQRLASHYPDTYNLTFSSIESLKRTYNITAVIITGDLVDSWDSRQEWDAYSRARNYTTIPVYTVAGNHDADSGENYSLYAEYTGEPVAGYAIPVGDFDLVGIPYTDGTLPPGEVSRLHEFLTASSRSYAVIATHYAMNTDGTLSPLGSTIDTCLVVKPTLILTGHQHGNVIRQRTVRGFQVIADLTNFQDGVAGGETGPDYSAGILYTVTAGNGRVQTITARAIRMYPDPRVGDAISLFPPPGRDDAPGDIRPMASVTPYFNCCSPFPAGDPTRTLSVFFRRVMTDLRHMV